VYKNHRHLNTYWTSPVIEWQIYKAGMGHPYTRPYKTGDICLFCDWFTSLFRLKHIRDMKNYFVNDITWWKLGFHLGF
jgi:hypothetical protein